MTNRTPAQLKQHYRDYQGTPEQIAKRSARNKARREMEKKLGKAAIKGKDIDHIKPIRDGGARTKMSNLRVRSVHANRGDTR
ncbi:HNH endonuclease [Methylobacterium sp. 285MFTsu5.1]|uniref:HNH endonuclease signature motif containing protein n=1 Tax=Methylobacterium sp. 285MFTsu5.1 TaxID=1172187 RepID=UPI0003737B97|nr:HNH endonuclease [Methylobacterium sp. 285MFTsu5.1]